MTGSQPSESRQARRRAHARIIAPVAQRLRIAGAISVLSGLVWPVQAAALAWAVAGWAGGETGPTFWAALVLALGGLARAALEHRAGGLLFDAADRTIARERAVLIGREARSRAEAGSAEIAALAVQKLPLLQPWITRYHVAMVRVSVLPLVLLALTFAVSWVAGLVLLVAGPLIPVFMALVGMAAEQASRRQMDEMGSMSAMLMERLSAMLDIRLLGAADRAAADFAVRAEALRGRTMAVLRLAFLSSTVLELFSALGVALVAVFVGFTLLGEIGFGSWATPLTLGEGVFVLLIAPEFFQPFRDLAAAWHDRAAGLSVVAELDAMDAAERVDFVGEARACEPLPGAVTLALSGAVAALPGRDLALPELRLMPGEALALCGPTGAGKSTTLAAIAGLVPLRSGRIEVCGRTLDATSADTWRARIALIPQETVQFLGVLIAEAGSTLCQSWQGRDRMRWKISIEGSDEITRGHRLEFEIEKSLGDLAAGNLGLSIDDGKAILASLQRHFIERQCALYVLLRRHCQGCGGTRPIKDCSTRTIQTVYGAVTVESPRLYPCRRCMPGVDFTITPVSELCPDRATAELMTLTAKLGALMPYRAAAEVLADFLPGQMPTRHTTLRHRTLAIGKRLEEKEEQRMLFEQVDTQERRQRELPLPRDPEREFVLSIDTAHIPQIRGRETRSFEAVICHASRGGVGSDRGILFAFSGTSRKRMRAEGLLALKRLGYEGKGDVTVISDGEDCLKRLKSALPQPATHILDWFHIAMKLRPIEQTAGWLARRLPPDEREELLDDIAAVRWRLWNGQTDRAIDLIARLFHDLKADEQGSSVVVSLRGGLLNLRIYVEQNRDSITNYSARYREGRRIASTAAEANVNNLVARRMVKKQQMRWSERGANLLLQVRVALANGNLAERLAYQPPIQPGQIIISPFVPVPLFQRAA